MNALTLANFATHVPAEVDEMFCTCEPNERRKPHSPMTTPLQHGTPRLWCEWRANPSRSGREHGGTTLGLHCCGRHQPGQAGLVGIG